MSNLRDSAPGVNPGAESKVRPPRPPSAHVDDLSASFIPDELKELPRWVCWRWVWRQDKNKGEGGWDKPPVNPQTGEPTDATDEAAWMPFDEARRLSRKLGDGIGFALGKDGPYTVVDLDHCLYDVPCHGGRVDQEVTDAAQAIIDRLTSYTETTPSQYGLRVWVRGRLPRDAAGKTRNRTAKHPGIEFYDEKRYLTVTGSAMSGYPRIEDRQAELAALHGEIFAAEPKRERKNPLLVTATNEDLADDDDLIRKARSARNGAKFSRLFDGDTSGYPSQSEAVFALCKLIGFWTGDDAARVERIFNRSELGQVGKWKDRPDYRARSIAKALENATFYDPQASRNGTGQGGKATKGGSSEGGFVGSVGDSPQESPVFAEDPRPLSVDLLRVPTLAAEMLPASFRGWIADIAARGCFPIEYPAAAALVALGSLVGRKLCIRPKRHDDWLVVGNLWGAVIGPPGLQKSPAIEEALRPLKRLAVAAFEAHGAALAAHQAMALVAKAKAEAAKDRLKQAARKKAADADLDALARDASANWGLDPPTIRRYIVNDATVEKLGELLRENPNGLLQFRDELTGFLRTLDRQGHENDRGFYLESWNGSDSYTYDRIGRGTVLIPNVCMSLFGGIQPGPLARYIKAGASGSDADGFIPRFQVLLYPDPPTTFRNVDRYPDTAAKGAAYDIFKRIDELDPRQQAGIPVDQARNLPFIGFCPAAQDLFDEWRTDLENRLRSGADNPLMLCHLSKYRSLMPALALHFHLIEWAAGGGGPLTAVTLPAAELSAAWCDLLEAHARRVYQSALDGDPTTAFQLADRLKPSLPNPFTCRQVAQKGWSGLDTVEDVRQAVGILEDRGWVKVVEVPPGVKGGRPSERVWVHPRVGGGRQP